MLQKDRSRQVCIDLIRIRERLGSRRRLMNRGLQWQRADIRLSKNAIERRTHIGYVCRERPFEVAQRTRTAIIHPPGEQLAGFAIDGHRGRLQPVLHLQPVFERAQEVVSVGKLRELRFANQPAFSQAAEADQSVRRSQPGIATAKSDLQRLGDELDFANAAATELDVEALLFPLALAIDFLFGDAHVPERGTDTSIRSKDAAAHALRKPRVEWLGSGSRPRAN